MNWYAIASLFRFRQIFKRATCHLLPPAREESSRRSAISAFPSNLLPTTPFVPASPRNPLRVTNLANRCPRSTAQDLENGLAIVGADVVSLRIDTLHVVRFTTSVGAVQGLGRAIDQDDRSCTRCRVMNEERQAEIGDVFGSLWRPKQQDLQVMDKSRLAISI